MSAIAYHRELIYSQLGELELRVADTMRLSVGLALNEWLMGTVRWAVDGALGERVRRVRSAVELSQTIALRQLEDKLASIELRMIWPLLYDICCDICLYHGHRRLPDPWQGRLASVTGRSQAKSPPGAENGQLAGPE